MKRQRLWLSVSAHQEAFRGGTYAYKGIDEELPGQSSTMDGLWGTVYYQHQDGWRNHMGIGLLLGETLAVFHNHKMSCVGIIYTLLPYFFSRSLWGWFLHVFLPWMCGAKCEPSNTDWIPFTAQTEKGTYHKFKFTCIKTFKLERLHKKQSDLKSGKKKDA